MKIYCFACSALVDVADGMVNFARCSCGSRCFRWDDRQVAAAARPIARKRAA